MLWLPVRCSAVHVRDWLCDTRGKAKDYLFSEEWAQLTEAGVLAAVHAAFSRDQVGFVNHAQVILITAMPRPLAL